MLKKGINRIIKTVVKKIFRLLPLRKIILFESNPSYACNTYPVFLYLRNILPQYKMVWIVDRGESKKEGVDDVIYINASKLKDKIKFNYYWRRSRAIVSCNRFMQKGDERQLSLFLCHGSKTKRTKGTYEMGKHVDFVNVQSHFFDEIITYEYSCEKSQLVYLGYPRCDCFYNETRVVNEKYELLKKTRYMIWLPTYRRHKSGGTNDVNTDYDNLGIPLIYSIDELKAFNFFLKMRNLHIIYKPHPVQDVSMIASEELSHIHIINDKDLEKNNLLLYEVIAQSLALITDYSSVFFDYLLLNRPIATTTDDIGKWKKARGFAFDLEAMYDKATVRVPDIQSLKNFVENVLNGIDLKQKERNEIRDLTNMYQGGNSSQRVAEFVINKLETRNKTI